MTVWALIGCTKTKADHPCTAKEMYLPSALFRGAWETAEAAGQKPLILSAKYGLLTPEQAIEPYDATLNTMGKQSRYWWATGVLWKLYDSTKPGDTFVSYLGARYAEVVVPSLRERGSTVDEPLKGLSQGKRLQWFKERRQIHAQVHS